MSNFALKYLGKRENFSRSVLLSYTPMNPIRFRIELAGRGSEAARAAMNDTPVGCQNREWTEPQRDLAPAVFGGDGQQVAPTHSIPPTAAL